MLTILLQAAPSASGGMWQQVIMIGAIILVFYFFMVRPQQKKIKDQKAVRESLKTGMNVVTVGGLHGKIVSIDETTVVIEVDKGIKLTFDKASVAMDASSRINTK
jgi:preprotein translocase subunit YajC